MLADYDFGDLMWTMFAFFFWFMLIWMFIAVFADIIRRKACRAGRRPGGWIVLIFILPLFGILIYLIARPSIVDARETSSFAGQMQGSAGYASPDHFA